jgi:hypothetical protein
MQLYNPNGPHRAILIAQRLYQQLATSHHKIARAAWTPQEWGNVIYDLMEISTPLKRGGFDVRAITKICKLAQSLPQLCDVDTKPGDKSAIVENGYVVCFPKHRAKIVNSPDDWWGSAFLAVSEFLRKEMGIPVSVPKFAEISGIHRGTVYRMKAAGVSITDAEARRYKNAKRTANKSSGGITESDARVERLMRNAEKPPRVSR